MSVEAGLEKVTTSNKKAGTMVKKPKDDEKSNTALVTSTIAPSANEAQSNQGH